MDRSKSSSSEDERKLIELDVRGLEPPQPILAILKKVGELPAEVNLKVQIDSNPWQLYDLLQQRGFFYRAEKLADGSYCGVATPRKHGRWIEKQLKTVPKNWENATLVFFRGEAIPLRVTDGQGDGMSVSLGPLKWSFGPEADLRGSVERELRQMAGPELIARTFELALENQLKVEAVQVRDQRSRWGSCSSRRQISLNW